MCWHRELIVKALKVLKKTSKRVVDSVRPIESEFCSYSKNIERLLESCWMVHMSNKSLVAD